MTQYSGKLIRKTPLTPTQQSASGVWTVDDAAVAVRNNAWPVSGVPDPISRSVRLRSSASASLTRTPATATNRKTWTWSGWVKRGALSINAGLFSAYSSGAAYAGLYFDSANTLGYQDRSSGVNNALLATTQVFRDPSAWYHIVMAMDSTQATSSNRIKLYVNGVQITAFSTATYPSLNFDGFVDNNITHEIGSLTGGNFYDGYLTEINFIDGQALTPSSFGTTDAFTGAWVPMAYTGTYGTNGFYLNFKDNTSTTTLGYDYSGNANNWTANNVSLTAGSTYDSMLDVPTPWIGYNTDGGVSVTRGNYSVLNPVNKIASLSIYNGNLTATMTTAAGGFAVSSIALTSGKWYFEVTDQHTSTNYITGAGLVTQTYVPGGSTGMYYIFDSNPNQLNSYANGAFVATIANGAPNLVNGDVIQVAYDADAGKIWFGKNGTWYPAAVGGSAGNPSAGTNPTLSSVPSGLVPCSVHYGSTSYMSSNFGQQPFIYTPPTGFKAPCTTNLPEPTIKLGASYMAATTWTSTGTTQTVTNGGNNTTATTFQPDMLWIKSRSNSSGNYVTDSVRGASLYLVTNSTAADVTDAQWITSLNSNGFSVGTNNLSNGWTNVAWQWKAAGSAVSNTNGTITSQVSAGVTQGFSVVTYTTTGSASTIGHGLGVAPQMVITKQRNGTTAWYTYHSSVGATKYVLLNSTAAEATSSVIWNNTAPTSSVFSIGSGFGSSETYVAYCFAEVAGYSKFGSYTGNGSSDGPFVYLGFRPRYVMIKETGATGNWVLIDTSRSAYNAADNDLFANLSNAEIVTAGGAEPIDILSNGFKLRYGGSGDTNTNGGTYIYACFAENPFKYSNAR